MYDNGLVLGHAWRTHCKGFVHARVRSQGEKTPVRREEESCTSVPCNVGGAKELLYYLQLLLLIS